MNEFADYLLKTENLLIVGAVWTLLKTFAKILPTVYDNPKVSRLMPLAPILLCSIAVWIPGAADNLPISSKFFLGIVLGAMVGQAHKIFSQTALGQDKRIQIRKIPNA